MHFYTDRWMGNSRYSPAAGGNNHRQAVLASLPHARCSPYAVLMLSLLLSPMAMAQDWDWSAVEAEPAGVTTKTPTSSAASQDDSTELADPAGAISEAIPSDPETITGNEPSVATSVDTDPDTNTESSSDWDWSAFEPMDDSPAANTNSRSSNKESTPDKAKKPRVGETAEPDFELPIRPAYELFANTPPFSVVASKKDTDMHPCADCHEWAKSDLTPRKLKEPHDNFELSHGLHGKGELWCFTCHTLEGNGGLKTLEGEKLDFDQAYLLCSQCHVEQARDWAFGAHGKRVGNWQGTREVYNCTACHYQHRPQLNPRKPMAGPVVRQGLERPAHWNPAASRAHRRAPIWERRGGGH